MAAVSHRPFLIQSVPKQWLRDADFFETLKLFREFRLAALQNSPEAFSSTYEDESRFPTEKWVERLQNPNAKQIVGILDNAERPKIDVYKLQKWVGCIVVLSKNEDQVDLSLVHGPDSNAMGNPGQSDPQKVDGSAMTDPGSHARLSQSHFYQLEGLFVHQSMRGKGLGRALIEASLAYVRDECERRETGFAKVDMRVNADNKTAYKLYLSCGFVLVSEERYQMKTSIKRTLTLSQMVYRV